MKQIEKESCNNMQRDTLNIKPNILHHYSGKGKENEQDIFILLRPLTNCYKIESIILQVLRSSPYYRNSLWLEYMANLPGTFLSNHNIMNSHYRYRYYFAVYGKESFTFSMQKKFERRFERNFDNSDIISPFEALERLQVSEIELARYWLCAKEGAFDYIEGQTVSKIRDRNNKEIFVINCDVPSLLLQHHEGTNCVVLLFRTILSYRLFYVLIKEVIHKIYMHISEFVNTFQQNTTVQNYFKLNEDTLQRGGYKRFFHYSNGPFEQLHDGIDFLYDEDGNHIALQDMTFAHYLQNNSIDMQEVTASLRNPIGLFDIDTIWEEHSLFAMTYHKDYQQALHMFRTMRSQLITDDRMKSFGSVHINEKHSLQQQVV